MSTGIPTVRTPSGRICCEVRTGCNHAADVTGDGEHGTAECDWITGKIHADGEHSPVNQPAALRRTKQNGSWGRFRSRLLDIITSSSSLRLDVTVYITIQTHADPRYP